MNKCANCGQEIKGRHFEDRTKIDADWDDLCPCCRAYLKALPKDAVENSMYGEGWHIETPAWCGNLIYRQSPDYLPEAQWPPRPVGVVESGGKKWRAKGDRPVRMAPCPDAEVMWFNSSGRLHGRAAGQCVPVNMQSYRGFRWLAEEVPEEGKWVECKVAQIFNGHYRVWQFVRNGHPYALNVALGMVGFGGILYANDNGSEADYWGRFPIAFWRYDEEGAEKAPYHVVRDHYRPATPLKVRFWRDSQ